MVLLVCMSVFQVTAIDYQSVGNGVSVKGWRILCFSSANRNLQRPAFNQPRLTVASAILYNHMAT